MTDGWKAVCFVLAVVLLCIDVVLTLLGKTLKRQEVLIPLAWAFFILPFAWDAAGAE